MSSEKLWGKGRARVVGVAGTFRGYLEAVYRKLSGNEHANLLGTRRHEQWAKFALVGAVANTNYGVATDGTVTQHQTVRIGKGIIQLHVERDGYLYAYANDAWNSYESNRGSVQLTVKRIS